MRDVIYFGSISVDGYIDAADGDSSGLFRTRSCTGTSTSWRARSTRTSTGGACTS